jgi:hypothetical protein
MARSAKIDVALETIASALHGKIQPGEITGTLLDDAGELRVEVTLRVTRHVSSAETARIRARAMTMLAAESWLDSCPATVKNRGPWAVSKNKGCDSKVTTVIVRSGYTDECGPLRPGDYRRQVLTERYYFACSHHGEAAGADVLAVVALDPSALKALRAKRQRESDERAARERAKERELEAEVRTLSDGDLSRRLSEFVAAHAWGAEDICLRERRRREQERTKPAERPVSPDLTTGGGSCPR